MNVLGEDLTGIEHGARIPRDEDELAVMALQMAGYHLPTPDVWRLCGQSLRLHAHEARWAADHAHEDGLDDDAAAALRHRADTATHLADVATAKYHATTTDTTSKETHS